MYLYIIGIVWLMGYWHSLYYCNGISWAFCDTQVSVTLYNSYSGDINYYNGNAWQFITWWNVYISNIYNEIKVSATDTSIYTISGDLSTWSIWGGSWNYSNIQWISVSNWDGEKYIQSNFLKIAEFYNSNVIKFILDQTPPSKPIISWPNMWSLQNNIVNFSWSSSVDTWVWFSWYYLYFSLNPNWPYTKVWVWSQNNYSIDWNLLPSGTIYWYISAIDHLWNASNPVYWLFHNKAPTILNGNIFNNNTAEKNNIYPQDQKKKHFVANTDQIQKEECAIHWYDDFSDCKAILDKKYILKNKIYEAYFAIKWLDEDKWLLPAALPNSWVDGYISDIDNKEYARLLPKYEEINDNTIYRINQYLENHRLPWLIVIILSLYIVYDKTRSKEGK